MFVHVGGCGASWLIILGMGIGMDMGMGMGISGWGEKGWMDNR